VDERDNARMFGHYGEARRNDPIRRNPERLSRAFTEYGLAGAQVPRERHDVARDQHVPKGTRDIKRVLLARGIQFNGKPAQRLLL
jgi:hypothetical protein